MITTNTLKADHAKIFRTGNPDSKEVIFIMGSCRIVPYVNYLEIWNRTIGNNRFLIYAHDPVNYHWNNLDSPQDAQAAIDAMEGNANLRAILESTTLFLHEYFQNYGMFNTNRSQPKNIYQFGMRPGGDVCIPNFHDVFIMFNDFCAFPPYSDTLAATHGNISYETQEEICKKGMENIDRFCDNAGKTDLPEMAQWFLDNWKTKRLFWTMNHVTKNFTLQVWELMNQKFLHLAETPELKREFERIDFLCGHYTPPTEYDKKWFGVNWPEPMGALDGVHRIWK